MWGSLGFDFELGFLWERRMQQSSRRKSKFIFYIVLKQAVLWWVQTFVERLEYHGAYCAFNKTPLPPSDNAAWIGFYDSSSFSSICVAARGYKSKFKRQQKTWFSLLVLCATPLTLRVGCRCENTHHLKQQQSFQEYHSLTITALQQCTNTDTVQGETVI